MQKGVKKSDENWTIQQHEHWTRRDWIWKWWSKNWRKVSEMLEAITIYSLNPQTFDILTTLCSKIMSDYTCCGNVLLGHFLQWASHQREAARQNWIILATLCEENARKLRENERISTWRMKTFWPWRQQMRIQRNSRRRVTWPTCATRKRLTSRTLKKTNFVQ